MTRTTEQFHYPGTELTLFEKAWNWKAYWSQQMVEFVRGDVLEVGAGIGANTQLLSTLDHQTWLCLEPDPELIRCIELPPGGRHQKVQGVVGDLQKTDLFDTILYIDVLEHIEDHREELIRAKQHLRPSGNLIVLSPAWPFLFSPFDTAIGHFRRYTRQSLRAITPSGMIEKRMAYLDSAGLLASAANRWLLRSEMPGEQQILTWDRILVPVSRVMDVGFGWNIGKSILGIWQLRETGRGSVKPCNEPSTNRRP